MATGSKDERTCFTLIWKIENASYFWPKKTDSIISPKFVIDGIEGIKWSLLFCSSLTRNKDKMTFTLFKEGNGIDAVNIEIEYQVDLLASDGTVLSSCDRQKADVKNYLIRFDHLPLELSDILIKRKSEFLPQDTLTVRCRIWKTVGESLKDVQWMIRTCRAVEKRSFLWKVRNFSCRDSEKKYTYEIRSLETGEQLISLDLFLSNELDPEEICFLVTQKDEKIKSCKLELYSVDAFGNAVNNLKQELGFGALTNSKNFSFRLSKAKSMKENNFLTFLCIYSFCTGLVVKETVISDSISFENLKTKNFCFSRGNGIERIISDGITVENDVTKSHSLAGENVLSCQKNVLISDFQSLLNEGFQSDIQLRTSSKTYPAHKCILSARSPVFKAMFSNDMKEKINNSVDIKDLSDKTVTRMLQYIYSAEVGDLEWQSSMELYEASDKYEILTLRDVCSSFLKNNLCQSNVCEALVLADLHRDNDLKGFVQDFIVKRGKDIVFSTEWEQLMETNLKLAAETMRLKYKE